jgi:hypothetical protein
MTLLPSTIYLESKRRTQSNILDRLAIRAKMARSFAPLVRVAFKATPVFISAAAVAGRGLEEKENLNPILLRE